MLSMSWLWGSKCFNYCFLFIKKLL